MSTVAAQRLRPRRLPERSQRVAVHAPAGSPGRVAGLLAAALPQCEWVAVRPGDRLGGLDAVVDLSLLAGPETDPAARHARIVGGTRALLAAATAAVVPRYVTVTSAMVLGAQPGPPLARGDDAALVAPREDCLLADLVEVEGLLGDLRGRGPAVSVLRPALVCGAGTDGLLGRHFAGPRLLGVRGGQPCWQFCHVQDLLSAVQVALDGGVRGAAAVASEGWLTAAEVARQAGLRPVELPAAVAAATAERLFRLRLSTSPASELAFATWPWVVGCTRLRAAGWRPGHTNESALQAQLDLLVAERALTGRSAGRSIAGAGAGAVALVGSAAALRAARRRRR